MSIMFGFKLCAWPMSTCLLSRILHQIKKLIELEERFEFYGQRCFVDFMLMENLG